MIFQANIKSTVFFFFFLFGVLVSFLVMCNHLLLSNIHDGLLLKTEFKYEGETKERFSSSEGFQHISLLSSSCIALPTLPSSFTRHPSLLFHPPHPCRANEPGELLCAEVVNSLSSEEFQGGASIWSSPFLYSSIPPSLPPLPVHMNTCTAPLLRLHVNHVN